MGGRKTRAQKDAAAAREQAAAAQEPLPQLSTPQQSHSRQPASQAAVLQPVVPQSTTSQQTSTQHGQGNGGSVQNSMPLQHGHQTKQAVSSPKPDHTGLVNQEPRKENSTQTLLSAQLSPQHPLHIPKPSVLSGSSAQTNIGAQGAGPLRRPAPGQQSMFSQQPIGPQQSVGPPQSNQLQQVTWSQGPRPRVEGNWYKEGHENDAAVEAARREYKRDPKWFQYW